MSDLINSLNDKQRQAVEAPPGNMLILAGAGSGKTGVLVQRIARLIQHEGVPPHGILAVTFTNKAAAEMRHRIEDIMQISTRGMWVGTFHGLAHRLLRAHWQEANLPEHFQILDSDDQYRLVRRVLKSMELDENKWAPRTIQWFISGKKDEGLRPAHIDTHNDPHLKTMVSVYEAYEQACQRGGLVDFAELLLRAQELWLKNPEVLAHYQQRFRHILVDEFQDTNTIQYAWIKLLSSGGSHVMCVGDDDQSIYGWRGAKIENIHRFTNEFPGSSTIRLEQNYRSTSTILKAANALIENNDDRLGKNLWTDGAEGEPVSVYAAFNEIDEARFIVDKIGLWVQEGNARRDVAILYRSNAQSRVIEEALIHGNMPYRVYGGMRFFERAEIKDALAYLRLISNRDDDAAFERVVNFPTRGIGERTIAHLRDVAREQNIALWKAAAAIISQNSLPARASNALQGFIDLINKLEADTKDSDLHSQTDHAIQLSGLWAHYKKTKGEKAQTRLENLDELVTACKQFSVDEDEPLSVLNAFLSHAALEAGESQADPDQDCVQMMTLHAAKGLEFPYVFIGGVEEGLFPHRMSIEEPGRLQEERRLCYVGMTRAMQKLVLTYAELRRLHGKEEYHRPSRFIKEIPDELKQEIRVKTKMSYAAKSKQAIPAPSFAATVDVSDTGFKLGQRVTHAKFGEGTVVNCEGSGKHARLQVNFVHHGAKWLVVAYANLEAA